MNSSTTPRSPTRARSRALARWALLLASCGGPAPAEPAEPSGTLTLHLHGRVGGEALRMDGTRYPNPGGAGSFELYDARVHLSHLVLSGPAGEVVEPDSVHLVRFSASGQPFALSLEHVPPGRYDRIAVAIGVDAVANARIDHVGDLDPNGQMAWNWKTGYKFFVLEGEVHPEEGESVPLVHHVGFSESYRPLTCAVPGGVEVPRGGGAEVDLEVDLGQALREPHLIDLVGLPSVKLDPADAALIADNYADMISVRGSAGEGGSRCTVVAATSPP